MLRQWWRSPEVFASSSLPALTADAGWEQRSTALDVMPDAEEQYVKFMLEENAEKKAKAAQQAAEQAAEEVA